MKGVEAAGADKPAPALLPFSAANDHLFATYARRHFARQVCF